MLVLKGKKKRKWKWNKVPWTFHISSDIDRNGWHVVQRYIQVIQYEWNSLHAQRIVSAKEFHRNKFSCELDCLICRCAKTKIRCNGTKSFDLWLYHLNIQTSTYTLQKTSYFTQWQILARLAVVPSCICSVSFQHFLFLSQITKLTDFRCQCRQYKFARKGSCLCQTTTWSHSSMMHSQIGICRQILNVSIRSGNWEHFWSQQRTCFTVKILKD